AIILVTLTLITEFLSRRPAREAMTLAARRNDLAATSRRNAEVLVAMGMSGRLTRRSSEANETYLAGNQRASDVAGRLGAGAKVLRMMLHWRGAGAGPRPAVAEQARAACASRPRSWRAARGRGGARAGRRLAAGPRHGAARRRGARPMVVGRARPPRRLPAAGRRIVRRHCGPEHLPFRFRSGIGGDHRRRQGSRRA